MQFRSQYQFNVLLSRNRSMSGIPKSIRGTLNPDPTSFVYDWVKPYLDDDDYPIAELSGKTRYYVVVNGDLFTSWNKEELEAEHGKESETYTYIPATLADNQKLEMLDASYRRKLDAMPEAKRKQLLLGCWQAVEESGIFFKEEWLKRTSAIPLNCLVCRAYDLAATAEDTPNTKGCDRTVGVKMAKSKDGYYYIMSSRSFRQKVGERDNTILQIAKEDGDDVHIVLPRDNGAGGKSAFEYMSKAFTAEGFIVKGDPSVSTASKLKKAEPFFSAVQNGLVFIIESGFERHELQLLLRELSIFDGVTKSTRQRHDDAVDAASTAFSYLNKARTFHLPNIAGLSLPPPTQKRIVLGDQ